MLVDTHVNYDPTADQIAEFTVMAAEEMLRMGIKPKAALLSHSNFGTSNQPSAVKMRDALAILKARATWLEVDGEMHGDTALDSHYRHEIMPTSPLTGEANLLCSQTSTPPTSPTTAQTPPAAASRSVRSCSARRCPCTS